MPVTFIISAICDLHLCNSSYPPRWKPREKLQRRFNYSFIIINRRSFRCRKFTSGDCCILCEIGETNRNARAISLAPDARHRANDDASIFHLEETSLSLSPMVGSSRAKKEGKREKGKNDVCGREATVIRSTLFAERRKLVGRVRPGN